MKQPSIRREDEDEAALVMAGELRVLLSRLKRKLREQRSLGDLTQSQVSVLSHLEREGAATVTALARIEGMRPQSMGATIATLEAAGLVSGAPDPRDGRQTLLSLTPACRKWIAASRAAMEDWLFRAIRTKFTPEEQQRLRSAIELMKQLLEP